MAFTKTPLGATSNYLLVGTDGIDITSIPGNAGPVTVQSLAGADQITIQSTDGVASGFNVDMGVGNDRVFADSDPNANLGSFILQNSTIRGGLGNDLLFGDEAGVSSDRRTMVMLNSFINGNEGIDIIRAYGMISSRIDGGKDGDQIEITNVFVSDDFTLPLTIPYSPDRYDGALVQGNFGADTITLTLGRTNVVNTLINGNGDEDLISNFNNDLSGNWSNSTIRGGAGRDTIDLQTDVSSSLLVYGDDANDLIRLGVGNDTAVGGFGNDSINIIGGNNLIYGDNNDGVGGTNDNGSGGGADSIVLTGFTSQDGTVYANSQNTVYAGNGADVVTITTNGNNVVYGDANTLNGVGGIDLITISGNGNNSVIAASGNDTVSITGSNGAGSNTVFGGFGADSIVITSGRDVTLFGEDGNDKITANISGAASISGGAGKDVIQVLGTPTSGVFSGGIGADSINISPIGSATYQQADGDSIASGAIGNLSTDVGTTGNFKDGSTISFATNGVDVITAFQAGNLLDTTLGTLGLDQSEDSGILYSANQINAQSGMVSGRSYYLNGAFVSNVFTVNSEGPDSLIVTQGNNGPLTGNSNSVVLLSYNASELTNANFV